MFGVSVKNLSKAERLIYGDSLMTHAMILTAVTDKVRSHKVKPRRRAARLRAHAPLPPHSLVSLSLSQDGKEGFEKWRVENSWGDDRGNKGKPRDALSRFTLHLR